MPMHDWTRVNAGIYHAFHDEWNLAIKRSLNSGLLPNDYYALTEKPVGPNVPDVIALQKPVGMNGTLPDTGPGGGVLLAEAPPRVRFRSEVIDSDVYARRAKHVTIRHTSEHEIVAVIEIVSPGNKDGEYKFRSFVEKAAAMIWQGIHLLVIDPFPPTPRDPQGIHKAIWGQFAGDPGFELPSDSPLTLASYQAGEIPKAFIEPTAVGTALIDMPVFLTQELYVPLPLEATYQAAWEAVPAYWRNVVAGA